MEDSVSSLSPINQVMALSIPELHCRSLFKGQPLTVNVLAIHRHKCPLWDTSTTFRIMVTGSSAAQVTLSTDHGLNPSTYRALFQTNHLPCSRSKSQCSCCYLYEKSAIRSDKVHPAPTHMTRPDHGCCALGLLPGSSSTSKQRYN